MMLVQRRGGGGDRVVLDRMVLTADCGGGGDGCRDWVLLLFSSAAELALNLDLTELPSWLC